MNTQILTPTAANTEEIDHNLSALHFHALDALRCCGLAQDDLERLTMLYAMEDQTEAQCVAMPTIGLLLSTCLKLTQAALDLVSENWDAPR